jgi:hypothetical protein
MNLLASFAEWKRSRERTLNMHMDKRYASLLLAGLCGLWLAASAPRARAGTSMEISRPSASDSTPPSAGWSAFSEPNQVKYDGVSAAGRRGRE